MVRALAILTFLLVFASVPAPLDPGHGNSAFAFNTYKNCYNKCVRAEDDATRECRGELCAKEKKKSRKAKCESSCFTNGEMCHKFCKSSCARGETCLRSKKTKACLKTCEPDRRSNVRAYLTCKNECTGGCSKW